MDQKLPSRGLFHLCVVYVLWSTTYMGMRVGVGPSSGFPPFIFGAMRFPLAALILLGIARFQGLNMRPTGRELDIPLHHREHILAGRPRVDTLGRAVCRFGLRLPHGVYGPDLGGSPASDYLQKASVRFHDRVAAHRLFGHCGLELVIPGPDRGAPVPR